MGYSPWSHKELDMTECLSVTHPLKKYIHLVTKGIFENPEVCFPFQQTQVVSLLEMGV